MSASYSVMVVVSGSQLKTSKPHLDTGVPRASLNSSLTSLKSDIPREGCHWQQPAPNDLY